MAQPFTDPTRDSLWFSVGLASSFRDNTGTEATALANRNAGSETQLVGCKVFRPSIEASDSAVQLSQNPDDQLDASLGKGQQVLVFKYKGKFHAIDNVCQTF